MCYYNYKYNYNLLDLYCACYYVNMLNSVYNNTCALNIRYSAHTLKLFSSRLQLI